MKLKLLLFFLIIFSFSITPISAQEFKAGMKLGANFTQVDGDDMGGYKKIGILGGFFVGYHFNKKNAIQFEMAYSAKGSRSSLNPKAESYTDLQIRVNYIDIPILYSLSIIDQLRFETGLMPSVLINGEELINGFSQSGLYKRVDLSYLIGASFFLSDSFSITGRFSYSILNIRKTDIDDTMHSLLGHGQFNNAISLSFNYHF